MKNIQTKKYNFKEYNKFVLVGILIIMTIGLFISIDYLNNSFYITNNNLNNRNNRNNLNTLNNLNNHNNLNTLNNGDNGNNSNINHIENFNNYNRYYIIATFDNKQIDNNSYSNNIYLDNINEDITINELEFEVPNDFNKNTIDIQIVNLRKFETVKTITSPINNVDTGDLNNNKYEITNKIGLDLLHDIDYSLVIMLNNENIYNNPKLYFKLDDLRFRFGTQYLTFNQIPLNGIIPNPNSISSTEPHDDNISLDIVNKSSEIISSNVITYNLEQFNKLTFVIRKPDMKLLKEKLNNFLFQNRIENKNYILEEFNKFIPVKYDVSIRDITENLESSNNGINPSFKIPNSQSFCINDNESTTDNNKCTLELYNLLPNHTYNIKIKIIYANTNNFNNIRHSNLYNENITISDKKDNDLLSSTLESIKTKNFTENLMKNIIESTKFNTYQNTQNGNLQKIQNNMDTLMNDYSL